MTGRRQYLKLKRKLLKLARSQGAIVYYKYGASPKAEYEVLHKIARVHIPRHYPYTYRLYILAHEVRHIIHHSEGLYRDYYDITHYKLIWKLSNEYILKFRNRDGAAEINTKAIPRGYKLPCLRTAYLAEMDCNRYALNFLEANGLDISGIPQQPYPYYRTMAYRIRVLLSDMHDMASYYNLDSSRIPKLGTTRQKYIRDTR